MTSVVTLRMTAEDLIRAEDDAGLLALLPELEADAWWATYWGPVCAIAARRCGRGDALAILDRAVEAGFFQPELFSGELEQLFGADSAWPMLTAQMTANVPPPPVELLDWPALTPTLPLRLDHLAPDREGLLRPRLPTLAGSAWHQALTLLHWVNKRWRHANDHVDVPDAIDILDRVDAGARFACVEYSTVLAQSLNAVGIPARRLALRRPNYHAGIGSGHVVCEAWIDGLDAWVVLDGQNGAYWTAPDGVPRSAIDVQQDLSTDTPSLSLIGPDGPLDSERTDLWRSYFHSVTTTGATWASSGFAVHFQGQGILRTGDLLHSPAAAYPNLAEVGITVEPHNNAPALRLRNVHPFCTGFLIRLGEREWNIDADKPVWVLPIQSGTHHASISAVTGHGPLTPAPLSYRVQ